MMDCNFFGTYYPTRYCLDKMKKNKQGIIVITASQAALMGIYGYGAYGATKFALRGLAETIAMEASHCGVSVSTYEIDLAGRVHSIRNNLCILSTK